MISAANLDQVERFTQVVPQLKPVDRDRYAQLLHNPENQSPRELNQLIPEMTEIEVDNSLSQRSVTGELTVAAWNLERGRHWREAVQLFRTHPTLQKVDVLCLSEMDYGMARAHNEHTTRELAQALGMNYAYGVEFFYLSTGTPQERATYSGVNQVGYHGNAILSRLPLRSLRAIRLPGVEKWYGSSENRLGGRQALFADIQVGPQTVTVISTHLESGAADRDKRTQEAQQILQAIAAEENSHPIILGGDLNAAPTTDTLQQFRKAGFLVGETNEESLSTYQKQVNGLIQFGNFRIDYILARGLQVASEGHPATIMAAYPCVPTGKMLSDHAIVTVPLQLPPD